MKTTSAGNLGLLLNLACLALVTLWVFVLWSTTPVTE